MRVLMIEDSIELAKTVKAGLERENISVDVAYTGLTGEEKAFVNQYDAILLDLNLPDKDGLDILSFLRGAQVETPIIIITARDEIQERAKGLDFGADDYLVKPFELLELNARLRAIIRRFHGRTTPQITIGDLVVNPICRQVAYGGELIALKPKEFDILLCIAENYPAIVPVVKIAELVYDEDFDPFSSVLRVHMARLKKKLADAAGKELLKNIRTKGYQICD